MGFATKPFATEYIISFVECLIIIIIIVTITIIIISIIIVII